AGRRGAGSSSRPLSLAGPRGSGPGCRVGPTSIGRPLPPASRSRSRSRGGPGGRGALAAVRVVAADQEAGVVAAEAEAVGHDAVDPGLSGDVGDVVEVALRVGLVEVD